MSNPDLVVFDLDRATQINDAYRFVIYTSQLQLTLMSLRPGEMIPRESHSVDQFIKVEEGQGEIKTPLNLYPIKNGTAILIPPFTSHEVKNTGETPLKLYSIYSKPLHGPHDVETTSPQIGIPGQIGNL